MFTRHIFTPIALRMQLYQCNNYVNTQQDDLQEVRCIIFMNCIMAANARQ